MKSNVAVSIGVLVSLAGLARAQSECPSACQASCEAGAKQSSVRVLPGGEGFALVQFDPAAESLDEGLIFVPAQFAAAAAQPEGEYTLRLAPGATAQPASSSTRSIVMEQSDGDNTYRIEVKNEKVKAFVNGERVSDSRIRRRDGGIDLMGEDGEVLCSVSTSTGPNGEVWGIGAGGATAVAPVDPFGQVVTRWHGQATAPEPTYAFALGQPAEPPKVMLGITMSDVDEETRDDLDFDGDGILIDHVIDDLPASKAGIRVGDIIIDIDGADEVNPEALRALLRELEPGDELTVTVNRGGREKDITIELEAYQAEKLSIDANLFEDMAPQGREGLPAWGEHIPQGARKAIEEAMRNLESHRDLGSTDEARRSLEQALKQLESARGSWVESLAVNPEGRFLLRGDPGTFVVPSPNRDEVARLKAENSALRAELDQLRAHVEAGMAAGAHASTPRTPELRVVRPDSDDRFDRLNERLERLERLIEKLANDR